MHGVRFLSGVLTTERLAETARVLGTTQPSVPHGWEDASANYLTDDFRGDPITGYPILKSKACRVRAVA